MFSISRVGARADSPGVLFLRKGQSPASSHDSAGVGVNRVAIEHNQGLCKIAPLTPPRSVHRGNRFAPRGYREIGYLHDEPDRIDVRHGYRRPSSFGSNHLKRPSTSTWCKTLRFTTIEFLMLLDSTGRISKRYGRRLPKVIVRTAFMSERSIA